MHFLTISSGQLYATLLGLSTLILPTEKRRLMKLKGSGEALWGVTKLGCGPSPAVVTSLLPPSHLSPLGLHLRQVFSPLLGVSHHWFLYKPQMCPLTNQLRFEL